MNIIGDVAGNYLTLMALLVKMPKDAKLVCLGDPNDRGPRSKEVIEFLMKNGQTLQSNHAHLMTETYDQSANPNVKPRYYQKDIWFWNGAIATMDSYSKTWKNDINFVEGGNDIHFNEPELCKIIPKDHIDFLKNCPMFIETEEVLLTHAPLHSQLSIADACDLGTGFADSFDHYSDFSLIWNRHIGNKPHKYLGNLINIFGHNASDKVKVYTTQYAGGIKVGNEKLKELMTTKDKYPIYAICLDTSSAKVLTGLHLPSGVLYEQEYID